MFSAKIEAALFLLFEEKIKTEEGWKESTMEGHTILDVRPDSEICCIGRLRLVLCDHLEGGGMGWEWQGSSRDRHIPIPTTDSC